MPGGQKRKSDFATEEEWKAYKAERKAKADARFEAWDADQRTDELAKYKVWEAERTSVAVELLSAWEALYTAAIATNNLGLVRVANRLHRATYTVLWHLLADETVEERWFEIDGATDPLYGLPELFEKAVLGETTASRSEDET